MEKLKLHSPDFTQENIARLAELFPNCITESRADDGTLGRAIDFDQLRQELSDHVVDGPRERYHLNWPGKREALLTANAPIAKTLRPCRDESVAFDTTKNLFIEGDNLDALKLLQETYLNKVKLIYIDLRTTRARISFIRMILLRTQSIFYCVLTSVMNRRTDWSPIQKRVGVFIPTGSA